MKLLSMKTCLRVLISEQLDLHALIVFIFLHCQVIKNKKATTKANVGIVEITFHLPKCSYRVFSDFDKTFYVKVVHDPSSVI